MKWGFPLVVGLCGALALGQSGEETVSNPKAGPATEPIPGSREHLRACIERHLGRPYVWGATGLKSFDCSGFVWRAMLENGIFMKRTTARKLFVSLKSVDEQAKWDFPTLVFFDDLEHIGIINDKASFFHAQCSKGTNLSPLSPFWRSKVYGFRAMPIPGLQGPPAPPPSLPMAPSASPGEPSAAAVPGPSSTPNP